MRKTTAIALVLSCFTASSAFALEAKVEKPLQLSAAKAWAAVGDFCGIASWHPALEKCVSSEKDGHKFRTLFLKGGGEIYERLEAWDDKAMSYTYTIISGVLPVQNYSSTLTIRPAGEASAITWSGKFDSKGASDADAVKTMTGVYEAGAAALAGKK